ncbi:hypothetical protein IH879_22485 [candidate division KSB1 bacterium]|nr:hypothetical protein [candidate division KSB1 bacterium]
MIFNVNVAPGSIFNALASMVFNLNKKWSFVFGHDFYWQHHEHITKAHNTRTNLSELKINETQTPDRFQHKISSEITYTKHFKHSKLKLGLGGDATMYSKNMGHNWTVYLMAAQSF